MEQDIVRITDLHASYGSGQRRVQALQAVDLHVRTGEIFGLLGPNGAGKSTLLAVLEGLHRPDHGSVQVAGIDVVAHPQQVKRLLGIQLQHTSLMDDLNAGELMQVYAAMYEFFLTPAEIARRLAEYGLEGLAKVFPRRLSGGQQQRLALALSQVNDPTLVLLDEPTSALDPHARRAVWDLIRTMQANGQTVLLTTHSMEEAEALCHRVAIIDRGQVIACDTPARLVADLGASSRITIGPHFSREEVLALDSVHSAHLDGFRLALETSDPLATLVQLYELAQQRQVHLAELTLRQPNLEDVFLQLTGRPLDGQEGQNA
jgi:ABC-2 type transport system ATP-binding protein